MNLIPLVADWWFGLCPKHPAIHTAPALLAATSAFAHPGGPGGDDGGTAKIISGAGIVLSGCNTLRQNKQLLWYSLMTGIVIAFVFIARYILRLLSVYPYDAIDPPRWFILTFAIELVSVFCLTILTAGLFLSLVHKGDGGHASFYEGICGTKKFLHPLVDWSVILALLGTAIYVFLDTIRMFPGYYTHLYFFLNPFFNRFPFDFILLPEVRHIGPIGGTFAMSSAVSSTAGFLVINGVLFFLTLFVVPLIVLEGQNITEAVTGSGALMKKVLIEAAGCFGLLILAFSATAATSLIFGIVYGFVAPGMPLIYYPGKEWIATAVLFLFVLFGLICVVSTVAGIAVLDLYSRSTGIRDRNTLETGQAVAAAGQAS